MLGYGLVSTLTTAAVAAGAFAAGGSSAAQATTEGPSRASSAATRVIVTTEPAGSGASARSAARGRAQVDLDAVGGSLQHVYTSVLDGYAATVPAGSIDDLRAQPGVVAVERDQRGTGSGRQEPVPSWGLSRVDQVSGPADKLYAYDNAAAGQGVTVYVLDSGMRSTHTEFAGRLRMGPYFADDAASSEDCYGHGTHVGGTVAGTTYGIAKKASLVSVRVLDCNNAGWYSDWIAAMDWINADHAAGVPAVVNASLGGGYSQALNDAVAKSIADGIVWAVSAGNSNADACTASPASTPGAITVGATTATDARAAFSSWSSNWGTCVDIFAPGVGITSAGIASDTASRSWEGTSMAAPHVAGVAARYLSAHPAATPAEVWSAIGTQATPGKVTDAKGSPNRLLYAARPTAIEPAAPTGVSASRGSTTATVSWVAPTDTGGSPITGYTVRRYSGSTSTLQATTTVASTARSFTATGLTNGSSYSFTVNAVNAVGTGTTSARSAVVTPATKPGTPTIGTASSGASGGSVTAYARWGAPSSTGGSAITGYTVRALRLDSSGRVVSTVTRSASATARGLTLSLTAGRYQMTVAAKNAVGEGSQSARSNIVYAR